MNIKRLTRTFMVLSFIALFVTVACAQRPAQGPTTGVMKLEGTKVTDKGKIAYMKSANAYVVRGETPPRRIIYRESGPQITGRVDEEWKDDDH